MLARVSQAQERPKRNQVGDGLEAAKSVAQEIGGTGLRAEHRAEASGNPGSRLRLWPVLFYIL